ncbi:MAG: hypothetical protein ACO1RX_10910 [Candidatus Sericytochromatia bacterium]
MDAYYSLGAGGDWKQIAVLLDAIAPESARFKDWSALSWGC